MPDPTTPDPSDLVRKIADLESQVQSLRLERDREKEKVRALLDQLVPYEPVTEAELRDMLHGPRGKPLLEVIEEIEREEGLRSLVS